MKQDVEVEAFAELINYRALQIIATCSENEWECISMHESVQ